jgi:transcriptional regulator with XRE-family HTH domain
MALRAEMGRSYAGGIERGERNASLTNLGKLARALEIPLSELFRMAEEELARAETKGRADG